MDMEDYPLNEQAALAARYVNTTNRHLFLTGKAGTGKTTFLRHIVRHTYKNVVVAAPTGIAAINAGGVTLHSLLQLPFGAFVPENIALPPGQARVHTPQSLGRQLRFTARKRQLLREIELLIIDEVSMLRADLLDAIDLVLRYVRRESGTPFGGLQLLCIGDLMQLPPVVKADEWRYLQPFYPSSYFFDARAWQREPLLTVELTTIYRQQDQDFIDLLNRLRHNEQTAEDLHALNHRYYRPDETPPAGYIHLTTHNRKASRLNDEKLAALRGQSRTYQAEIEGDFPEHLYPTEASLTLKTGAQVMFIKNDPSGEGRFFNGKIGRVSHLEAGSLRVTFPEGEEIEVPTYRWDNIRYTLDPTTNEVEETPLGSFSQYPLKLAWAVTVHKSQGLTFEKAVLDVEDTFAPGQLYVALSRLTSLDGLWLASPLPAHPPAIDATLQAFVDHFPSHETLLEHFQAGQRGFIAGFAGQAFGFGALLELLREHARSFNKAANRSLKQQYLPWTEALIADTEPLEGTGATFIQQVRRLLRDEPSLEALADRLAKAQAYFEPLLFGLQQRVREHRRSLTGQAQVKTYREELEGIESAFHHQCRQMMKLTLLVQETAQGRLPTKEMLRDWEKAHPFTAPALPGSKTRGKSTKSAKKPPAEPKVPSAQITYELLQAGHSPEEIAQQRQLALGTVHGHLCRYVERGELDVYTVVDMEKAVLIMRQMDEPEDTARDLKERLGDAAGYGEIKLVMAHVAWQVAQAAEEDA